MSKNGKNVLKKSSIKGPPQTNTYRQLTLEIKKIKTVEQIDIVGKMIYNDYLCGKIIDEQMERLYSKLNEQASKVGEKKVHIKIGPLELGGEKKGKIL